MITFQRTSKLIPNPPIAYKYYKWHITEIRTIGQDFVNLTQVGEFVFLLNGSNQSMSGVTVSLLNGHISPMPNEVVSKLIDGDIYSKFLDLSFANGGTEVLFEFPSPIIFNGYKWSTGNDAIWRDPKSWTLYGSNDNTNWDILDIVTDFISIEDRYTFNASFTYTPNTSDIISKVIFTANPPIPATNDGTTALRAGESAYQIKRDFPNSADGLYWIQNPNINSGTPFQIYADMTTLGGGWTLILANSTYHGWTFENSIALNTTTPPSDPTNISQNYSIIGWADYIKQSESNFDYMFDANFRGYNGGAYTALSPYSFIQTPQGTNPFADRGDPFQNTNGWRKNISEIERFNYNSGTLQSPITGSWEYNDSTVEFRMPFYTNESAYGPDGNAFITTNGADGSWWGTLVTGNWNPVAPWMNPVGVGYPTIIWYWVR
jgi:hypothetical protein